MPLQKQNVSLSFGQGVQTKTDPWQLPAGTLLSLVNSTFTKGPMLVKRAGFGSLTILPEDINHLTTFMGNLTAIGTSLLAYGEGSRTWTNQGPIQPLSVSTLSLAHSPYNITQVDTAFSPNGYVCTVLTVGGSFYYQVQDSETGQIVLARTQITRAAATYGVPRVFTLGNYFVVVYTFDDTGTYHLEYISIAYSSLTVGTHTNITSSYTPTAGVAWDGFVANDTLYLAWNGSDMGGAIRINQLSSGLSLGTVKTVTGKEAYSVTVTADITGSTAVVWVSFFQDSDKKIYTLARSQALDAILAVTDTGTPGAVTISNIASGAQDGSVTIFYEYPLNYSYDSSVASHYVSAFSVTVAGVVGTDAIVMRGVGLASKIALRDRTFYFLSAYYSPFQPTYILLDRSGQMQAKLAYSNGGGYVTSALPSLTLTDDTLQVGYLFKDLLEAVNKDNGITNGTGLYSQTGARMANLAFDGALSSAEIGGGLHTTGGFLWLYDGVKPVEHGFTVWPDSIKVTTSTSGGHLTDQLYYYAATYEWTDAQGNIHRSAPSIPVTQTTAGGNTSTNTINVPTLRLTYKTGVKIVLYRWSTAQQTYYRVTSISSPTLSSTATNSVAITDTLADSSIVGNDILYTTGGVVENIAAPACTDIALFKSRLFLIDAEDPDLLWYSKQVIEATPVETSDLFTEYVAPTTGAKGSTGPTRCLSAMDDKLILFKQDAIYYITGNGPDNTGANDDLSEPVFITATVGCSNARSIVFQPKGLMFQSDKGIWLLSRDLSTTYVGAPVEAYNSFTVTSATAIPDTNEVRLTLDNGVTLMYDYYYQQWGTYTVGAVSSTLCLGLHTILTDNGEVRRETPGAYLDGSRPVLMSFSTAWINLAGLQGFQRLSHMYLLGKYYSPHKLNISLGYDYEPSPSQSILITPDNYEGPYGAEPYYGQGAVYGSTVAEKWRIFPEKQKCEALQISIAEVWDPSQGVVPGAGLTLSGINLVAAMKRGWRTQSAKTSAG